jgi:hypothetical protein
VTVVIVCCALLAVGVAAVVRWGSLDIKAPGEPLQAGATIAATAMRYWWWVGVLLYTGLTTGVFVVGPAGRLAMRILAATAGSAAQGRKTEADEIVGRITVGGTIGIFIFVGIFFGLLSALAYFAIRRFVPRGVLGGIVAGGALLAVAASRIDPLRRDNADFDLVGPGWLAIVIFASMALLQGMAVVAFAGRVAAALPEPSLARPITLVAYAPLAILAVPTGIVPIVLILGFGMAVLIARTHRALDLLRSRNVLIAGRVALAILVVAALPVTVSALTSIAGRP